MPDVHTPAPEWQTSEWLNTEQPLSLAQLRGKVVLMHAFQMLCPGCVTHGVPQAERIHRLFGPQGVAVVGIHTVFEHHAVMGPEALQVFLQEFRITHPIGIDTPVAGDRLPATMRSYRIDGTPSLILIDRGGNRRLQHFGRLEDLAVAAELTRLMTE